MSNKAVFLDRDGVINRCAPPHKYIRTWDEFTFLPGAIEGIRRLNEAGFQIFVITNQRGIARGLMTMEDLAMLHTRMCEQLEQAGARIDGIYVCPHGEGVCDCRKPRIGLFKQVERQSPIDKVHSWMIGDSQSDILSGQTYGVKTVLIDSGKNRDFGQTKTSPNLLAAAQEIIEEASDAQFHAVRMNHRGETT